MLQHVQNYQAADLLANILLRARHILNGLNGLELGVRGPGHKAGLAPRLIMNLPPYDFQGQ